MGIIACVVIGGITGWIIDTQTRVSQIGHILSITIGILGATFGWLIFSFVGSVPTSIFGAIFLATASAAILLVTMGLLDTASTAPMDRT